MRGPCAAWAAAPNVLALANNPPGPIAAPRASDMNRSAVPGLPLGLPYKYSIIHDVLPLVAGGVCSEAATMLPINCVASTGSRSKSPFNNSVPICHPSARLDWLMLLGHELVGKVLR